MKAIYFSTGENDSKYRKLLMKYSSYTLAKVAPMASNLIAEKLFCTPVRGKLSRRIQGDFKKSYISVMGEKVAVYEKGTGDKVVLFSHGWSGSASDFNSFYDLYVEAGYKVVSLDHIAHGSSSGKISNFYFFYKTIQEVFNFYNKSEEVHAVVAHSMGAGASIAAKLPQDVKLCLLSPAISVFDFLYSNVKKFGLSPKMVKSFLQSYEKRYSISIDDIDPKNILSDLKNEIKIFQCEQDQFVPLEESKVFMNENQLSELVALQKLGHFRILKSQLVAKESLRFINELN